MDSGQKIKIACTGLVLVMGMGLTMVARKVWARRAGKKPTGAWKQVGRVTELNLYPLKSCKGIQLNECRVTSIGIEDLPREGYMALGDRRMVIYKEDALDMVSARTYVQMLQLSVEAASEDEILLTYNGQQLKFKIPQGKADRRIRLWTEQVPLVDAGDDVADWLQKVVFNGKPNFRLGCWPNVQVRRDIPHLIKKFEQVYPFMSNEFTGAFSDLGSFLLVNVSSVADLNSKIAQRAQDPAEDPETVSPSNFRGNILISGPSAFEEDDWNWVRVGDHIVFKNFKHCTRCSLTTINPNTSERSKNLEPITTLNTYRLLEGKKRELDKSPAMGIYIGLWTEGQTEHEIIKVGDPIYVCD